MSVSSVSDKMSVSSVSDEKSFSSVSDKKSVSSVSDKTSGSSVLQWTSLALTLEEMLSSSRHLLVPEGVPFSLVPRPILYENKVVARSS
ncbi:hypothetical protein F2Q70_00037088 [Brassica cretica]|uniref:Uncharacterized protein n=1 Tax=Brassica cretica TaxID=69181 RepID=A0A3N6R7J0_BRACR|nr:hypothetical protein F2Q70_00037088 [Brassica cretica]KAF3533698.1 hypothetical protein DY000_02042656 [Brassica cretica]